jgi:hypothetical protein
MNIIKISEYPYGRIYPRLRKASKWINTHRKQIKKDCKWEFDYPDYWNIPKKIANKLSCDEVDFLQEQTYDWTEKYIMTKEQ